jgi:hypothetical protein
MRNGEQEIAMAYGGISKMAARRNSVIGGRQRK